MKKYCLIIGLFTLLISSSQSQIFSPHGNLLFQDSIKFTPLSDWITIPNKEQNIWEAGLPNKALFNNSLSGKSTMITDSINPYPVSRDDYFLLSIPLSDVYTYLWPEIILSFYHKFNTDTLYDGGIIEISYDDGESWVNVIDDKWGFLPTEFYGLYSDDDTIINGINSFTGNSHNWEYVEIRWIWLGLTKSTDLEINYNPILKFRFVSDEINNNKDGWMIDELVIRRYDVSGNIQNNKKSEISIFPNPCEDYISIIYPIDRADSQLELFSLDGRKVFNSKISKSGIFSVKDIQTGIYIYKISDNKKILGIGRLIKK